MDDDWPPFEDEPTRIDSRPQAIAGAIPSTETTGKYVTLQGYEVSDEIRRGERGIGREEMLCAFRLAMMEGGTHPEVAREQEDRLRAWYELNRVLVAAAMGRR